MLVRHAVFYLFARAIPGLSSLALIVIYSRLLSPSEYGTYALVVAASGLMNSVFFFWIRLVLTRFLPDQEEAVVKSFVFSQTIIGIILSSLSWIIVFLIVIGIEPVHVILGIGVTCGIALFEMHQELFRATLQPWKYGVLSAVKAVGVLLVGTALVYAGVGAQGALLALILTSFAAVFFVDPFQWRRIRLSLARSEFSKKAFTYGFPLSVGFLLLFVLNVSDRFVIEYYHGASAVGRYSVPYDIASYIVTTLLVTINVGTYPLVIRAKSQGVEAERDAIAVHGSLLLGAGLPLAIGFVLIGNNLSETLLGQDFREEAWIIMPLVALAAVLAALRAYYFDLPFHLEARTLPVIFCSAIAATANIVLNISLVPMWGARAAALTTLVAVTLGAIVSMFLARRIYRLPVPRDGIKIILACVVMAIALWPFREYRGLAALIGQVLFAVGTYFIAFFVFNIGGGRSYIVQMLMRGRACSDQRNA